jgi:outer membrane protein OmpA-like peptidoglycan-associated protein
VGESGKQDPAKPAGEPAERVGAPTEGAKLLRKAGEALMPIFVTAGSLLGFVAFAGAVIVWTRFFAIHVPPDQAVKAVPRSELVATGSSLLLLFGFFGVIAVVVTYLVDRGGRATPGMSRALLTLVAVECAVAVSLASGVHPWQRALIGALLVFLGLVVLAATFVRPRFVLLEDTNRPRGDERRRPKPEGGVLFDIRGRPRIHRADLVWIGRVIGLLVVVLAALWLLGLSWPFFVAGVVLALVAVVARADLRHRVHDDIVEGVQWEEVGVKKEAQRRQRRLRKQKNADDVESERLATRRPYRLVVTIWGGLVAAAAGGAATVVPALVIQQWWLAVSFGSAVLLAFGLWRIAGLSKSGFMWFGFAVFFSVPLFGTLTLMARNLADPQVQPVAIIRSTDGPDEAIQGIYVTEGSNRVYFANVATEGCENRVTPGSGRLLWVPKDEVVAMSVGPLQGVADAGKAALEMAYGLTPSVETPAAGAVSLTVPEKRSEALEKAEEAREAKEAEAHAPGLDQRLESPGPAVRPNFGSGLSVVPEIASPGEQVELRLSVPNQNVDGFGRRPEGRTLRLNGVPVSLAREGTRRASSAEYVRTDHNQVLSLDKLGIYRMREGRPHLLEDEPEYEGPRFVRLEDSRIEDVRGGGRPKHGEYLEIRNGESKGGRGKIVELGTPTGKLPEVRLAGERNFVGLESGFLRQAWHSDRIAFEVPEHGTSGVITIDCGQLAGAPLLRVAKPPQARIEARMRGGSKRVVFDGSHSRDAASPLLVDRWTLGRRSLGAHKRVVLTLRPRKRPYRVRLEVTDSTGAADTAELLLLRLPESFFGFGSAAPQKEKRLREARRSLERLARRQPPSSIELDGNADDVGTASFNLALSLRRAERVREALLAPRAQASTAAPRADVPVTLRAFGESCPIVRAPGHQSANRRVDVFILDRGDSVATPKGCKAGRVEHAAW